MFLFLPSKPNRWPDEATCLKSSAVSSLQWLNVTPHPLPGPHKITQVQCRMLQDKYKVRKKQNNTSKKFPPTKAKFNPCIP